MKKFAFISAAAMLAACACSAFAQDEAQAVSSAPESVSTNTVSKLNLTPGSAKLMVWQGLIADGSPIELIDSNKTFSVESVNKKSELGKALANRDRYYRWEGYVEVKADGVIKFNMTRATRSSIYNLPGASLLIDDKPVISMKSEPSRVKKGQASPVTVQSVPVSLAEGYHKITVDFAIEYQSGYSQSIDVTYALPDSDSALKITPNNMLREVK